MTDLRLGRDGTWRPVKLFPPDTEDIDKALEDAGWEWFLALGNGTLSAQVRTWRKPHENGGPTEYMMEVGGYETFGDRLFVDDLPTLMNLLAQWAPVIQAAAIADVTEDLQGTSIDPVGLVEAVSARAAYGADEGLTIMRRAAQQQRITRQKRRAERARQGQNST